ncbi:MAG: hypothetical protein Phog2KO_17870 [Phototrophicaceae bacterium]
MTQLSEQSRYILKHLAKGLTIGAILNQNPDLIATDIAQAAEEALRIDKFQRETSSRKAGETNLRTYEVWTHNDDNTLCKMLSEDYTIQEIAKTLERHPMSIRRRMSQLSLET